MRIILIYNGSHCIPDRVVNMIVCVCNRVSDRDIKRLAAAGCDSFEALQLETGAATCCGCCETCARETLASACAEEATRHASRHITLTPA